MPRIKRTPGDRIAELRRSKGFSQAALGWLAGVGNTTISNYETNYCLPNIDVTEKIAAALETPTEYIVSGRGEKSIYECRNPRNFVKIPVYTGSNYMDIMQIGNDAKCDTLTLPCLPETETGSFAAICAPDNYMDSELIQKGDLVIVRRINVSVCDIAEVKQKRIDEEIKNGKIYAFIHNNELFIRRIHNIAGAFTTITHSRCFQNRPKVFQYDEIMIIGECVLALVDLD